MIELTERAVAHVERLMADNGLEGHALRVGIEPGGCSGFSYLLDLVEDLEEGDEVFEQAGIQILCDPKSHAYLDGMTIDYAAGMMGGAFSFENPNAKKSCGCGTSFMPV